MQRSWLFTKFVDNQKIPKIHGIIVGFFILHFFSDFLYSQILEYNFLML